MRRALITGIGGSGRVHLADLLLDEGLSQLADGVIAPAHACRTPEGHLAETLERLRQVNTELIGLVLDGVPTKGRYSRSYGGYTYGYRNSYTSTATAGATTAAAPAASTGATIDAEPVGPSSAQARAAAGDTDRWA